MIQPAASLLAPCGIVASLHTPFTTEDVVDEDSLGLLVEHVGKAGCAGLLTTAVAGEVGALRPDERRRVLRVVAEAAAGPGLAMIAGVSARELETSLELAREATAVGAAMVLWQPPAGLDESGLEKGLLALGEACPGGVMLQDLDWYGSGLAVATIGRLAERVPALKAVKLETVAPGPKYSALRAATGGRVHLSGGWAAMQMLDGLARGLDAFMPSGLLAAYARVFELWQAGERDASRALFERMLPVIAFSNQHIEVSIRFWKRLRVRQGIFRTTHCRPPLRPLDDVEEAEARLLADRATALDEEMLAGRQAG